MTGLEGAVKDAFVVQMCDAVSMTVTSIQQEELAAHNASIRLESAQLVADLRDLVGAQLVAYIGGVRETRAVREWVEATRAPRPDALQRLRMAYRVATLLSQHESPRTVHAWFQGLNPMLNDQSPARVLRNGNVDDDGAAVLSAARALAMTA